MTEQTGLEQAEALLSAQISAIRQVAEAEGKPLTDSALSQLIRISETLLRLENQRVTAVLRYLTGGGRLQQMSDEALRAMLNRVERGEPGMLPAMPENSEVDE